MFGIWSTSLTIEWSVSTASVAASPSRLRTMASTCHCSSRGEFVGEMGTPSNAWSWCVKREKAEESDCAVEEGEWITTPPHCGLMNAFDDSSEPVR